MKHPVHTNIPTIVLNVHRYNALTESPHISEVSPIAHHTPMRFWVLDPKIYITCIKVLKENFNILFWGAGPPKDPI